MPLAQSAMPLAHSRSMSELPDMDEVDLSYPQSGNNTLWNRSTSLPIDLRKTEPRTITKRDLEAFMGQDGPHNDTPLASFRQDIALLLKASMSPQDRIHFVNPFQVHSGACSTNSSLGVGKGAVAAHAGCSDFDSDSDSEIIPSEHAGNECSGEGLTREIERIFAIMTELMVLYDLETCLACIRENDGERLFVVHHLGCSEMWRTQMYIYSSNFSELMVQRGIPTLVPDISKDPRFVDASDARSQIGRSFVQGPIGWKDEGSWIGVINLVGKKALSRANLQDYDTLMERTEEIASLKKTR